MNQKITCCYQCQERHPLCHANCIRYQTEREKLNQLKAARAAINDEIDLYKRQRINRVKR
ncbi:hypothetical protein [Anaerotignum neopropionicum]|uniref:hypothetical protein n=1 Tax=Anaerotignum neopropionicum TaxID=36847 RepID=UPI0008254516|nr:hypothetical protein [Anaerotignum neopropionicum]